MFGEEKYVFFAEEKTNGGEKEDHLQEAGPSG